MAKTKAKAKSSRIEATEALELVYDLEELPSVQHRAGLAGLYVLLNYLSEKRQLTADDFALDTPQRLRVKLNADILAVLFKTLYAAKSAERSDTEQEKKKRKKPKTYHRIDDGRYYYWQGRPASPWLHHYGMGRPWIDQWEDAVMNLLLCQSRTQESFYEKTSQDWEEEGLERFRLLKRNSQKTDLKHYLYLGSAALDTEHLKFYTSPQLAFLLEFTQVVLRVYPLQVSRLDRRTRRLKPEPLGKVLVYQEPTRLDLFFAGFKSSIWQCSDNDRLPSSGYVRLPGEAGLDCFSRILEPVMAGALPVPFLRGVLCFHLVRDGNDVKIRQVDSLKWNSRFVHLQAIVRDLWHPHLKRLVMLNGLKSRPFYHDAHRLCETEDSHFFVGKGSEVVKWLARDCKRLFETLPRERTAMTDHHLQDAETTDNGTEPSIQIRSTDKPKPPVTWEITVKRLVLNYIQGRCIARLGLQSREQLNTKPLSEIEKHWENAYSDLFFKLRSSRNQERFAEVFTSVLVGARDPYGILREPAFQELSNMLTGPSWTTLKSVTFLALGAASRYLPLNKKSPQEGANREK